MIVCGNLSFSKLARDIQVYEFFCTDNINLKIF